MQHTLLHAVAVRFSLQPRVLHAAGPAAEGAEGHTVLSTPCQVCLQLSTKSVVGHGKINLVAQAVGDEMPGR